MDDKLTLVDVYDRPIGEATKTEAHSRALLHRAFSIFIYRRFQDNVQLLIQQRATHKYHSGGLWTNTCCSHPRLGENLSEATKRRLKEEVGIECYLEETGSFVYYHAYSPHLFEYEYDHIFVGEHDGEYLINPDEVADAQWISIDELALELLSQPEKYTPWFRTAAPMVLLHLKKTIEPINCTDRG